MSSSTEILSKFKKLKKIINNTPKNEFCYRLIINDLVFLVLSVEKILSNRKYKKNIYLPASKILDSLIFKLGEAKKMSDYSSNIKIKKRVKSESKVHQSLFQNLWIKFSDKQFQKDRLQPYKIRVKLNKLIPLIKGKKCVDFGCGHGQFLMALKSYGAKSCLGLDFGKKSISFAKKISKKFGFGNKDLKYIYSKAQKTPLDSNCYDFAIQNGVFHHIEKYSDELKAYKEVHRVLKKNGYFFVFTGGSGGLRNIVFDNAQEILRNIDQFFIVRTIRNLPITNNKKYMLSDNLIAKYRNTTWTKTRKVLKEVGFRYVRPLRGHASTDFDKYFTSDKLFKKKVGEGHIRLLCQKI